MKRILFIISVILVSSLGCATDKKEVLLDDIPYAQFVGQLKNDGFELSQSMYGLVPTINPPVAEKIWMDDEMAVPYLIEMLNNNDQFLAAHGLIEVISQKSGFSLPTPAPAPM